MPDLSTAERVLLVGDFNGLVHVRLPNVHVDFDALLLDLVTVLFGNLATMKVLPLVRHHVELIGVLRHNQAVIVVPVVSHARLVVSKHGRLPDGLTLSEAVQSRVVGCARLLVVFTHRVVLFNDLAAGATSDLDGAQVGCWSRLEPIIIHALASVSALVEYVLL